MKLEKASEERDDGKGWENSEIKSKRKKNTLISFKIEKSKRKFSYLGSECDKERKKKLLLIKLSRWWANKSGILRNSHYIERGLESEGVKKK